MKTGKNRVLTFFAFTDVSTDQGSTSSRGVSGGNGLLALCTPGPCPVGRSSRGAGAAGPAALAPPETAGGDKIPSGDDKICAPAFVAANKPPITTQAITGPRSLIKQQVKFWLRQVAMGCSIKKKGSCSVNVLHAAVFSECQPFASSGQIFHANVFFPARLQALGRRFVSR